MLLVISLLLLLTQIFAFVYLKQVSMGMRQTTKTISTMHPTPIRLSQTLSLSCHGHRKSMGEIWERRGLQLTSVTTWYFLAAFAPCSLRLQTAAVVTTVPSP